MKTNTGTMYRGLRPTLLASCLGAALALGGAPVEAADSTLRERAASAAAAWRQPTAARPPNPLAEQWKLLHPPPPPHPQGGTTHVVTNCNDAGAGSLRAAVVAAASGDTIDLSSLACSSITLTTGTIATGVDDLAVVGPGRDLLTISGGGTGQVFVHVGAGQLYLRGFTLTDGAKYSDDDEPARGGCLYSQGSVFMVDAGAKYCIAQANGSGHVRGGAVYARAGAILFQSTISGSTAHSAGGVSSGGGLYSPGSVLAKYSIFRNNAASTDSGSGYGGAAFLGGDVTIVRSAVHANSAGHVGGLLLTGTNASQNLVIDGSTIADNYGSASFLGAGVYLGSNAVIRNSTISGNTEANANDGKYGAGLSAKYGSTIELVSTIVAGNTIFDGDTHLPSDIGAALGADPAVVTGSHNLAGFSASILPGDTRFTLDPLLGPLGSNGGPTPTMPPLTGSLAFNAGIGGGDYDQRGPGYPRNIGAGVDIGAFESDALFIDGFD